MNKILQIILAIFVAASFACSSKENSNGNANRDASNRSTMDVNTMNPNVANQNSSNQNAVNPNTNTSNTSSTPANPDETMHMDMQSAPDANNAPYDLQFLDTMIAHHQGAVDMAKLAATNTNNADLKKFAAQIIADQTKEISQMKDWREKWFGGKPSAMNMEMPGMRESMQMDMSALGKARDKEFDVEFVRGMIPHHEGAVTMAREALTKSEHDEIKQLANQIIKAQEAEIKMMHNWETAWTK